MHSAPTSAWAWRARAALVDTSDFDEVMVFISAHNTRHTPDFQFSLVIFVFL